MMSRVGHPDPASVDASYRALADFHDELWERTGLTPEQTVLGGFSMGTVMSYALGLARDRPAPAGILAASGFIPAVEGWEPYTADRRQTRVFIAHGRQDPVISVEFARRARALLQAGGIEPEYHEFDGFHQIDAANAERAGQWLAATLTPG